MTQEIQIAVIGGIATVIAPLITLLIKNYLDNVGFPAIGRKRNLSGKYRGNTVQTNGRTVEIDTTITSKTKTIKGEAYIKWESGTMKLKIKGHFLDENYIYLFYQADDKNIKNFGSQILRINGNATILEGLTIGYGSVAEKIISGETKLQKQLN